MARIPRRLQAPRLASASEADGFVRERVRGSHPIYRHADRRRVVVANHSPSDTFPVGTRRGMIDDAGRQDDDLRRLGLIG